MNYEIILAQEFNLNAAHSKNIIELIDDGNSIPFIARYRKELTGSCDDQVLRELADRLEYLRKLDERKAAVTGSITEQGFMTGEIARALEGAKTLTEVEDIYRPYKPKRKTRATVAVAKGLQPLADIILAQEEGAKDIKKIAAEYINEQKGVLTVEDAIDGAKDIIAEAISDNADLRKALRGQLYAEGLITALLNRDDEKLKDKILTYEMYDKFTEPVKKIANHRVLAINRAENEGCLRVNIEIDEQLPLRIIGGMFVKNAPTSYLVGEAASDAYSRLIKPSVEGEVRRELFERAGEQAIKMFEVNLKPLLLQPPIRNKVTLGLDPAYRTGCKIAVVDGKGDVLDRSIVYFTMPHNKVAEAKVILKDLIKKHGVEIISIGNGTASKESEIFVAELIKEIPEKQLSYMVVNEAGASVYSASKLGAEEFPDFDVAHRSAVSIARRLQDPLAELIKIDPKSIGVGQYQHDMPQRRLDTVLGGVVEDCVNSVGVDLNSASFSLLAYVAGLNASIAKNIIATRAKIGGFSAREQLLKVPKLGPKAYEQCAGFLRIINGGNILDNTAVHPESYEAATKLLDLFKLGLSAVSENKLERLGELVAAYGEQRVAEHCNVGVPTLNDITDELMKPGRDLRDSLPPPMLRSDIMDMSDLKEGMELVGTVRNVIDFGVFVDVGVHQDGLVHISEITDAYIRHPSEVLTVGEIVKVRVLAVDKAKNRISLTMKGMDSQASKKAKMLQQERDIKKQSDRNLNKFNRTNNNGTINKNTINSERGAGGANGGAYGGAGGGRAYGSASAGANVGAGGRVSAPKKELSLEDALKALSDKYGMKK
jgi:uncharacterized protein